MPIDCLIDYRHAGVLLDHVLQLNIAIALAKDAKILLLDEPTSGLDPTAANEFTARIREVAARGVAVLMATHARRSGRLSSLRRVPWRDAHVGPL